MVNGADLCLKRSVPNGEVLCKRPVLRGGDACSGFSLFPLSFAPYLCVALPPETLPAFKTSATAFERILHGVIAAGFFSFLFFSLALTRAFSRLQPTKDDRWWSVPARDPSSI